MKLRSIIFGASVAAAATASALTTTNMFARLPVQNAPTNAIIALPFSGCGMAEGSIYVTNLVMTSGLSAGDTLLYKDSEGNWYAWEISGDKWTSIASGTKGGVSVSQHPASFTLPCGEACWLNRSTPGTFYLYGQVNDKKTDVVVKRSTNGKVNYQIVGCPWEAGTFDISTISNAATGDTVLLMADNDAGRVEYLYTNSNWCASTTTVVTHTLPPALGGGSTEVTNTTWSAVGTGVATVPAGCGFMYGRKATSDLTINWGD